MSWALLRSQLLLEWRYHPWRQAVALLAIALGVALAFSVQLINASALAEFGAAVRSVNGQPDFELRGSGVRGIDEALYARVASHPGIGVASPIVELDTYAIDARGERVPLRILGIDALVAPALSIVLMPRPQAQAGADDDRFAIVDPDALFLNAAAQRALGTGAAAARVQAGQQLLTLPVRGSVAAQGAPLAVMDIAGAQAHFGWLGRLSRIDVRLAEGANRDTVLRELALPADVRVASPDEAQLRVSNLSRAYRVNLTVLALVALFTGAFLVFSIQSVSVAKRIPQLALLGVLGLAARERRSLVLWDALLLGMLGSALGIALGTVLALIGLRWLGGDLGSGMLGSAAPVLHFSLAAALGYGALGVAAAVAGSWWPARVAERLVPAQSLKGLGTASMHGPAPWLAPTLLALGTALAFAPAVGGLPLAAYASVACVLLGGLAAVPAAVDMLLRLVHVRQHAVALLAVERARDQRHAATVAVAGVVAALSLAVALTVMVASFRDSVSHWLDQVLPADLYARTAATSASAQTAYLDPSFVQRASALRGVLRVQAQRNVPLVFDPARPAVSLVARPIRGRAGSDEPNLPLVGTLAPARAGGNALPEVYASENFAALYGKQAGDVIELPMPDGTRAAAHVRGLWRDYARAQGSIAIDLADWRRLSGDERVNDLALWLSDEADVAGTQAALRALADDPALLELATPGEIRAVSLRIFDRSFAVTYWLQAVAIGIGLFGISASFSAQVLARRKEFGSLQHLGFTRGQVLALVATEGAVWTAAGALLGLALGLAVSMVLVHVVNPQSFHWRMDLSVPWPRLAALAAAVLAAGALTAWMAGRAAATREMALAVKEDW